MEVYMIIEFQENRKGEWWFEIKGSNGKTVARSDIYGRKDNCLRVINKLTGTASWKVREVKK
jgi:uncharacterized protein YegP (UPF0339 family)